MALLVKTLPANARDVEMQVWSLGWGDPLGWEDSPGGSYDNPLQYSFLENPTDRGAWWTTVHRVAQSQTQLKWLSTSAMVQRLHFGLAKTLLELRYSLSLFLPSPAESFLLSFHRYQTCIAVWGFPYLHLLFLPLFFTGVSPSKSLACLILCSPLSLRGCYLT